MIAMAKRNRLTNNSDETDIASLISGDTVFSIPYFQRAYKWKTVRLKQLNQDVLNIVDGSSDIHFLGAIIVHGRRANPSDPDVYEVIDGQQRITTLFIYLFAVIKTLCILDEYQEAAGILLKYLVINRETSLISNLKLHPCKEDRSQLNCVLLDILSDEKLKTKIGSLKPKLLPPSGKDEGTLRNNYRVALRFFSEQNEQGGLERVRSIYRNMLEAISVVQIDVWDPTNGPKIFDSLNSRQEPMTIGDLVRNEIFSRVAHEHPDKIEQIHEQHWQPFYEKFKQDGQNLFDAYFFPYGLVINPNLKKSEVYSNLRDHWQDINDPEAIIKRLSKYQNAFIDIVCGTNHQHLNKSLASHFHNLYAFHAPGSVYPFLMQLSNSLKEHKLTEENGIAIIDVIESFLIRRAVSGHEPTGLHAVFKRLWVDCAGKPDQESVITALRKHKTVVWPNNEEFGEAIMTRALYGVGVTRYVILEYDKALHGDHPDGVNCWIEHVLPDHPVKEWFNVFTKEQHNQMKDRLANLIPLSEQMNRDIGNSTYDKKRPKYSNDSSFKSTRKFASGHEAWNPTALEKRSKKLAEWAKKRWKS